jgi:opacity protein-like surface antigen
MGSFKLSTLVGAAFLAMPLAAVAADFPEAPPYIPPVEIGHQWYLRGHIGMAAQHLRTLDHVLFADPVLFEWLDRGNFDAAPIFGLGIGYQHSDHVRFDLTAEYRGKASFSALDRYDTFGAGALPLFNADWGTNDYTAKKSEFLFLANGYYDIGTWHGVTPYVGAGVGVSYNIISDFRDTNVITAGGGYAGTGGKLNLAWALHAGASMQVTDALTIDLGYSFVSLGDAQTGILYNLDGTCTACQPMYFRGITSHDLKLGVRWAFDHNKSYYPVVAKY